MSNFERFVSRLTRRLALLQATSFAAGQTRMLRTALVSMCHANPLIRLVGLLLETPYPRKDHYSPEAQASSLVAILGCRTVLQPFVETLAHIAVTGSSEVGQRRGAAQGCFPLDPRRPRGSCRPVRHRDAPQNRSGSRMGNPTLPERSRVTTQGMKLAQEIITQLVIIHRSLPLFEVDRELLPRGQSHHRSRTS